MAGLRSPALPLGLAGPASHGTVAVTNQPELISAASGAGSSVAGALQEANDQVAGAAALPIGATAALVNSGEGFSASAGAAVAASAAAQDLGETISIVISGKPGGFRALSGFPLGAHSLGISGIQANAPLVDSDARAASTAGNGVLLTSINPISDYRITATPDLVVGDRVELLSAVGGPLSDITINPDGTFQLTAGSSVSSFDVRVWSIVDQDWGLAATQTIATFATSDVLDQREIVQAFAGPVIGAASALFDRDSSAAAAGITTLGFVGVLQDSRDTLAAAIVAAIAAQGSIQDGSDATAGSAALALSMSAAANDLPELVTSLAGNTDQLVFESPLRDSSGSVSGDAVLAVAMSGSVQDLAESLAAGSALPAIISSGVLDVGDGMVSVLAVARSADVSLRDAELEILANNAMAIVADFAGIDRASILRAGATLLLVEKAGGYVAKLVVADRSFPLNLPARVFTLSPNTGTKS